MPLLSFIRKPNVVRSASFKPRPFVLYAPSGAGKDTLLLRVPALRSEVRRRVTLTTFLPRPGEIEGADYRFVEVSAFFEMRDSDRLLERAEARGNYDGNSREWVERTLQDGFSVILRIDVQGALTIREMIRDAVLIFVEPPSREERERRLKDRGTESEEDVKRRPNGRWRKDRAFIRGERRLGSRRRPDALHH